MGQKTLFRSISIIVFLTNVAWAQVPAPLELRAEFFHSPVPLTTERIWTLDPEEPNPHLKRWILAREVELGNLSARMLPNQRFGVQAKQIFARTQLHERDRNHNRRGWFYRLKQDFPCTEQPVWWFASRKGVRQVADQLTEDWQTRLVEGSPRLVAILSRISGATPDEAIQRGQEAFRRWRSELNREWRRDRLVQVRKMEWDLYLKESKELKLCSSKRKERSIVSKRKLMERELSENANGRKKLFRMPAREWAGSFAIRLDVRVGNKKLNGQFLIDASLPMSLVSPRWLRSQGVNSREVEDQNTNWIKVEGGISRVVRFSEVKASGFSLPLNHFVLLESRRYSEPQYLVSCCDGVLGRDFLKKFVFDFHAATENHPAFVQAWDRKGYRGKKDDTWVALRSKNGELMSEACSIGSAQGVSWRLDRPESLRIDRKTHFKDRVDLVCNQRTIAKNILPTVVDSTRHNQVTQVGMGTLGRGMTLDLGHGRIWFPAKALKAAVHENRSGLAFEYQKVDGRRKLFIKKGLRTLLSKWRKRGLVEGTEILEINSTPSEELDWWQVERRLSGGFGDKVVLKWKWKDRNQFVVAPIPIKTM